MTQSILLWVRSDLRLSDNPALTHALAWEGPIFAVYIQETDPEIRPLGAAARWWLHQSLDKLERDLAGLGIPLQVESGNAAETMLRLARELDAENVVFNRRYGPGERTVDQRVVTSLRDAGIKTRSCHGSVLAEPWDIATKQGKPFSVFAPFFKALRTRGVPQPLAVPKSTRLAVHPRGVDSDYQAPRWSEKFTAHWSIGEAAAQSRLADFLLDLSDYPQGRDYPSRDVTSRLSPHLRHGEISPRQLWHAALALAAQDPAQTEYTDKLLSELSWRDFNYHQLFHRPDISSISMQPRLPNLFYRQDSDALARWQRGLTGIPMVDAGMRELWDTGWMQNRVRMLTASFLVKNLLADWRLGEAWFWDCLVDADPANNAGNWQWIAGTGFDASPFFRIFNPVTQGERYDADGAYVRRFVPELAGLPDAYIQRPFDAPKDVLKKAGIRLGETYPSPLVDLVTSRQAALDALRAARAPRPDAEPAAPLDAVDDEG